MALKRCTNVICYLKGTQVDTEESKCIACKRVLKDDAGPFLEQVSDKNMRDLFGR